MLTGGNVADCKAGAALPAHLPDLEIPHGDKESKKEGLTNQGPRLHTIRWQPSRVGL